MSPLPPLPASNTLIAGRVLLVLPSLAAILGFNEALVLQQVRYRLGDDCHPLVRDGQRWARDPLPRWQERDFPFWDVRTVQRAFASLERRGVLRTAQFDRASRDRTKSCTIDFAALTALETRYRAARDGHPPSRTSRRVAVVADPGERPHLPPSDLLIDEPPLVLPVALAVLVGIDEALLLQQIRYWMADGRNPPIADGRRWVVPQQIGLLEPFAFRRRATLAQALRNLEARGFLVSSTRFNKASGDRTKWLTIDFAALAVRAEGDRARDNRGLLTTPDPSPEAKIGICRPPLSNSVITDDQEMSSSSEGICRDRRSVSGTTDDPDSSSSLIVSETEDEIDDQNEQQYPVPESATSPDDNTAGVVVTDDLAQILAARGITITIAERLRRTFAPATLVRQIEVFDFLRAQDPNDPKLTAGRLRRQIEEDWAAPSGFVPAVERAALVKAAAQRARDRRHDVAMAARQAETASAARQALLDAIGLNGADQALWARAVQASPPLPPPFRDALFHAPRNGEAAAVLFREPAALDRATGPAHATTRASVAARIAALCSRTGVPIHYLAYDDVLRLLASDEGGGDSQDL